MEPGRMYSFIYQIPGVHRKPRESVLKYIDEDSAKYFFSGRPFCGTQEIDKAWISEIHEVSDSTPMMIEGKRLG